MYEKDTVQMSEYFPKLISLRKNVKVELGSFNYAKKAKLKIPTGIDMSSFA